VRGDHHLMTPLPSMAVGFGLNTADETLPAVGTNALATLNQPPSLSTSDVPHPNKPFAHVPRRVPVDQLLNPDISASITQTWTDQAIKCYLTDSDCANCSIPRGHYSFVCQMNLVVPALLQTLGEPDGLRVKKLLPYLSQY
jgi:hypothetical protein